ncbi:hypothetical protein Tco_0998283 [Tanacetum coccineum]
MSSSPDASPPCLFTHSRQVFHSNINFLKGYIQIVLWVLCTILIFYCFASRLVLLVDLLLFVERIFYAVIPGFLCVGDETRFFESEGGGGGRGVKEKQHGSATCHVASFTVDEHGFSSLGSPTVEKVIDSRNNNDTQERNVGQCSTPISTSAASNEGNVLINVTNSPATLSNSGPMLLGPTSYAKLVTGEPRKRVAYPVVDNCVKNTWSKYGLVKSMLNSSNELFFFKFSSKVGMDAMFDNGPWSSYVRSMIELRADVKLKDTIVKSVSDVVKNLKNPTQGVRGVQVGPKVGFKPTKQVYKPVSNKNSVNSSGKKKQVEESRQECLKKIVSDVVKNLKNPTQTAKGVHVGPKVGSKPTKQVYKPVSNKKSVNSSGKKKQVEVSRQECLKKIVSDVVKNLKNPTQTAKGVHVGPKVGSKPTKQVYKPISNKNSAISSGKKKQPGVSRQEVNNSNTFDALNLVENDDDLGTNGRVLGW